MNHCTFSLWEKNVLSPNVCFLSHTWRRMCQDTRQWKTWRFRTELSQNDPPFVVLSSYRCLWWNPTKTASHSVIEITHQSCAVFAVFVKGWTFWMLSNYVLRRKSVLIFARVFWQLQECTPKAAVAQWWPSDGRPRYASRIWWVKPHHKNTGGAHVSKKMAQNNLNWRLTCQNVSQAYRALTWIFFLARRAQTWCKTCGQSPLLSGFCSVVGIVFHFAQFWTKKDGRSWFAWAFSDSSVSLRFQKKETICVWWLPFVTVSPLEPIGRVWQFVALTLAVKRLSFPRVQL